MSDNDEEAGDFQDALNEEEFAKGFVNEESNLYRAPSSDEDEEEIKQNQDDKASSEEENDVEQNVSTSIDKLILCSVRRGFEDQG